MLAFKGNRIVLMLLCGLLILSTINIVEAKSNEEIYQEKLDKLKPDDIEGHYQLGLWCLQNKLLDQAKTHFNKVFESTPDHKKARQGMDSVIQLEKDTKMSEIIKKYGPYKGVLDKAGATKENLPWEKAREKETDHFIVKTNLSVDALNDICVLLECAYFTYQDLFGCEQPKGEKLRVMVAKNKEEYQKISYGLIESNPPAGSFGIFIPALNPRNKSRQNHLLSYYELSTQVPSTSTLLHECTHYAMYLVKKKYVCSEPPIWFNEGWATYCGTSRLEGNRLVTNVISQTRLPFIKAALNQQTYIKLNNFINLPSKEYTAAVTYAQGWSLIYFLLNGQDGKYKTGLQAYMEAWKNRKIGISGDAANYYPPDKPAHLKLFEESIGMPIDQLEKEWKEYILGLK